MSAVPESVHWIFLPQVEITTQNLFYLRLRYFLSETFGSILSYVLCHTPSPQLVHSGFSSRDETASSSFSMGSLLAVVVVVGVPSECELSCCNFSLRRLTEAFDLRRLATATITVQ